jgi:hypothetical protein
MDFSKSLNFPGTEQDLHLLATLDGFSPSCTVETRVLQEEGGWAVRLQLYAQHPLCRLQRRYIQGLRSQAEAQAIASLYEGLKVSSAATIPYFSHLLALN